MLAGLILLPLLLAACSGSGAIEDPAARQTGAPVFSMQLVTSTSGWALTRDGLRWTEDGGITWSAITRAGISVNDIKVVFFLDGKHGWVTASVGSSDASGASVALLSTSDGGHTWGSQASLPVASPTGISTGSIDFVDDQNGWVMLRAATNTNFSLGELFRTSDGGLTWTALDIPIGGAINFVSVSEGWTAGGPAGDQLYVTSDGGNSWERQAVKPPPGFEASYPTYGLPALTNSNELVLAVAFGGPSSGVAFYSSSDSGNSWTLRASLASSQELGIPALLSADVVDSRVWALADGARVLITDDAGANWRQTMVESIPGNAPEGIVGLDFASSEIGWALTSTGLCPPGIKLGCTVVSQLLSTEDGGQTWTVRTP